MIHENQFPAPIDIEPNLQHARTQLLKLTYGEVSPSEVSPIVISDLRKRKNNPSVTFYLTNKLSLTFDSRVAAAYKNVGAVVLAPEEDIEKGYKWIDVYGIEEGSVQASVVGSLRINTESQRLESQGWYGPERQTFLDLVAGKLEIEDSNELPSFKVSSQKKNSIYLGRVDGQDVRFSIPPSLISQELEIVPKRDTKLGYLWIDGYSREGQEKVLTRRVIYEDGGIQIVDWAGYEMQTIKDWINGKLPTDDTKRAEIIFDENRKNFSLELGEGNRILFRDQSELDKSMPVYFSAKESGPYKWIEVGQEDEDTSKVITRFFLDYSDEKLKIRGGWPGPQKQGIADFIERKSTEPYLESFTITIDGDRIGYITSVHGRNYRIALRSSAFNEGEKILVTPLLDEKGRLILEARSPSDLDTILARSVYDRELDMFKTTSELLSRSSKPQTYWSSEKILETARKIYDAYGDLASGITNDSSFNLAVAKLQGGWNALRRQFNIPQLDDNGIYVEETGVVWTHGASVARRTGRSLTSVQQALNRYQIETRQIRAANGKKVNAYKLDEAMARFKKQPRSISTEEADELLRSVFN